MSGSVRSARFSPRFEKNIALAMVSTEYWDIGEKLHIEFAGVLHEARAVKVPFC